ncbi:MAG TPA: hypothetical protein VLL95_00570 [Phnomibacter sp.]|nr:hypothetical protein [Phnomibacter sp.]
MRLKITDTNFTSINEWLFRLVDESENVYYIMNEPFYRKHNIKSPVSKKELDCYGRGQWITVSVEEIDGKRVVVNM